jgi:UDP-glucose 4-epimerase
MQWLITGGAGFIGSHLAKCLRTRGDQVRILDDFSSPNAVPPPKDCHTIMGDICDPVALSRALEGVDGCFHLAAILPGTGATADAARAHQVNQAAALGLFAAASHQPRGPIPIVYASSAAVYGDAMSPALSEDDRPIPRSQYGVDKLAVEGLARAAWYDHQLGSVGLRFFNVYGSGQRASTGYGSVIARFIDAARRHQDLVIDGDGAQNRDFVHVSDAVDHLYAAMILSRGGGAQILNVCTGQGTTIRDLARLIITLTQSRSALRFDQHRANDIRQSIGSPIKAGQILNLRRPTDLATGLRQLLTADQPALIDSAIR